MTERPVFVAEAAAASRGDISARLMIARILGGRSLSSGRKTRASIRYHSRCFTRAKSPVSRHSLPIPASSHDPASWRAVCTRCRDTRRLPRATRDTERVETGASRRKQKIGACSTRDSSLPAPIGMRHSFRTQTTAACSIRNQGRHHPFRLFFARKGGTTNQPCTHVSHRKQKRLKIQGRNVPVHLLMAQFSTLASNLQTSKL